MTDIEKQCVVCGESCAGQPRTKDPRGRYYHRACHEQRQGRRGPAPLPPDDRLALLSEVLDEAPAPAPAPAVAAPAAGMRVEPAPMPVAPQRPRGERRRIVTGVGWPTIIGGICVALGGLGVLVYGPALWFASRELPWSQSRLFSTIAAAAMAFPFLMSFWHLQAGIGVLRRAPGGASMLRRWAAFVLVLSLLVTVAVTGFAGGRGIGLDGPEAAVLKGGIVISALLLIGWPLFLLIWLAREAVRDEIDRWEE